jgi:hypothetical protein
MELAKIVIGTRRIAFIAGRMFSKLKGEEKAVVVLVSFAVLLVPISPVLFGNSSSSDSISSEPEILQPKCIPSLANVWSDVHLYLDSACTKPFATIVGGGKLQDGRKGVLLKFDTGETEWKLRESVTGQTFIKTDDPARTAMQYQEVQ